MGSKAKPPAFYVKEEDSRLFGENSGTFPRHHFLYPTWRKQAAAPLDIEFAGPDENNNNWWRKRENSNVFSIEWVRAGSFDFVQNKAHCHCEPGDVFFVRRNCDNHMTCRGGYSVKWTVALCGTLLEPLLDLLNLARIDRIRQVPEQKLRPCFEEIFRIMASSGADAREDASCAAYRILLLLSQCRGKTAEPDDFSRLLEEMEQRAHQKWTIPELARFFQLRPAKLYETFHAAFQMAPMQYLLHLRMRKARALLLDRTLAIKDVAKLCGYHDGLYFSQEFHRLHKMSPSLWRKRKRMEEIS
ncbi:MAG: AraC family transcriptional regulator [Victivallaceae bacterium]|nr:AraC family transcriptional regulator [Victivallaceae bacterium]